MLRSLALAAALTLASGYTLPFAAPRPCASAVTMAAGLRTGDTVLVRSGADKGTTGKILSIDNKKSQVVVEGVNVRTKHVKPRKEGESGQLLKKEMPVHISNVSPCVGGKPTRVRFEVRDDGSKARIASRDGSELHVLRAAGKKASK